MKILRFFVGLSLLPLCVAVTQTVTSLLQAVQPSSAALIPPSAWSMGGGFALWLVVYFTLPAPMRTYVLAHELTHALWGSAMGARVLDMKVSKDSGSVTLSKSNFVITLAPYFFPLYTVLVIAGYYLLSAFYDLRRYELIWLGLVGATWAFHFTFTWGTLLEKQSDIRECGHVFSYAFIYMMNVLGLGLWVVMLSSVTIEQMIRFLGDHAWRDYSWAWSQAAGGVRALRTYAQ
jgi:hypothetical protein